LLTDLVAVDSGREGGSHTVRVLADDVCVDPERDDVS
jgi:hypothetical protein